MELYWIYLSFVRKRAPLNIQIKLTNFVKLPNCVSLKSSKNGLNFCFCLRYKMRLLERKVQT